MSGHTPGPWKLEGNWAIDAKPQGGWVSTMHPSPLFELTPVTGEPAEIAANACLIAAAPELLTESEAVKQACDYLLSNIGHVSGIEPHRCALITAVNKLDAVIFKATGAA